MEGGRLLCLGPASLEGVGAKVAAGIYANVKFAQQLMNQIARDGIQSAEKSLSSLEKRLAEHLEKLPNLDYKSSVEREIRNFEKQIETARQVLKDMGL